MSFPADGMESAYRNKIDGNSRKFAKFTKLVKDVAQLLRENHPDHFMVYNLSERPYDYTKFGLQVFHCVSQ
jgi:hypothetical protein